MAEKCEATLTCIYGSQNTCDYIEMTGKSRVKDNPAGQVKDGKCGCYKEGQNERTRLRARDRWDSSWTGGSLSEVD